MGSDELQSLLPVASSQPFPNQDDTLLINLTASDPPAKLSKVTRRHVRLPLLKGLVLESGFLPSPFSKTSRDLAAKLKTPSPKPFRDTPGPQLSEQPTQLRLSPSTVRFQKEPLSLVKTRKPTGAPSSSFTNASLSSQQ